MNFFVFGSAVISEFFEKCKDVIRNQIKLKIESGTRFTRPGSALKSF